MAITHNHRRLDIWSDGINLVDHIYEATKSFPKEELFALTSQMQRAAVSVPSNIAEGAGKGTNKDFAHFLSHALGSLFELETQVIIANRRNYISKEVSNALNEEIVSLQRRVCTFREKLINPESEVF